MKTNIKDILMAGCVLLFAFSALYGQNQSLYDDKGILGIAFIKTMFPHVAINDASAAIKVYIKELQRNLPVGYELRPVMFDNCEELIKNFNKENLSIVNLSSVEYLLYKSRLPIIPVTVSSSKDSPYEEFVILVKNDNNINSLKDLRGKRIGMLPRSGNPIPYMWFEVLLTKDKVSSRDEIINGLREAKAESQTIMSVFFGQLEACIVSRRSFQLMTELNPQTGIKLKTLASSPGYINGVSCFTAQIMKSPLKEKLYNGSLKATSIPAGQQIFTLMRIEKIVPFKEEYLDGIKKLLSDYNLVNKKKKQM